MSEIANQIKSWKWFTVVVDHENNAEEWWDAVREEYPELVDWLGDEPRRLPEVSLDRLRRLPGWSGGPAHAPHPLIVTEAEPPPVE